jgi:hypothetical protein
MEILCSLLLLLFLDSSGIFLLVFQEFLMGKRDGEATAVIEVKL